jgi:AraC-like DNA-binding protein
MHVHPFKPHPDLRAFVNRFAIIQAEGVEVRPPERFHPTFHAGLVFNLHPDYSIQPQLLNEVPLPLQALLGATTRFADYVYPPHLDLLVVRLQPTGLYHLLGRSVEGFTNQVSDLNSSNLSGIQGLYEELRSIHLAEQRIKLLEEYLLGQFTQHATLPGPVEAAINYIHQCKGVVSIEEITRRVNSSRRNLVRLFHERVGMSPKTFLRIFRFNGVVQTIKARPESTFQDVFYLYGYYDQSHFIRDFKELLGQLPSQFVSEQRTLVDYLYRL